jgi:hypothetical protein
LNNDEYNRLKLFIALMTKMHSAQFEKAAGAFSDLFTHILESSKPQLVHFKQMHRLASDTGKLDKWLKLQGENENNFTAWKAMPIAKFLQISFLPESEIAQLQSAILQEFDAMAIIVRNGNLGSKVNVLLEKISKFLKLPAVKNDISKQEVTDILHELGLLLKTDSQGNTVVEGDYYLKLAELYESLQASIKVLSDNKDLVNTVNRQIQAGKALDEQTLQEIHDAVTALGNNSLLGSLRRVAKLNTEVKDLAATASNLQIANLDYQDGGVAAQAIKSSGDLKPVRALLFILQQFAPDVSRSVFSRTIMVSLNPVVEAMCSAYFGQSLENVKKELLRHDDLVFSQDRYAALQKAQTVNFIKKCLEQPANAAINWDTEKSKIGIGTTAADKARSLLVLRACEFLTANKDSSAISSTLSSNTTEAIVAQSRNKGINNSLVMLSALKYRLQTNHLANDADRSMFASDYLQLPIALLDDGQKLLNLSSFFTEHLAFTFKGHDLVKLVGTLPGLKHSYDKAYTQYADNLKAFLGSASDDTFSAISITDDQFNEGEQASIDRNIGLLKALSKLSDKFLNTDDNTSAVATANSGDAGFPVTAGIKQLEFDKVLNHKEFYAAFYNASKILPLIELKIPSDEELDMFRVLVASKLQSAHKPKLNQIIINAKKLGKSAAELSTQIKGLFEFVNAFKVQKDLNHNPNGADNIDFYRKLLDGQLVARVTGGGNNASAGGIDYAAAARAAIAQINRGGSATGAAMLGNLRVAGGTTQTSAQQQQAVAPAVVFKDVFGDVTALDALPFKNYSENDIAKLIKGQAAAGDDTVAMKMDQYFVPLLAAQTSYFRSVDFTKLKAGDIEKNTLQFINQLMACVDLYLRMQVYAFSDKFSAKTEADGNKSYFLRGIKNEQRQAISAQLRIFKTEYFKVETVYSITKQLNAFRRFDNTSTDTLNRLLRTLNPNLRQVISDAFIAVFEAADFNSNHENVITPIFSAINQYLDNSSASNNNNPKLSDIVDIK